MSDFLYKCRFLALIKENNHVVKIYLLLTGFEVEAIYLCCQIGLFNTDQETDLIYIHQHS